MSTTAKLLTTAELLAADAAAREAALARESIIVEAPAGAGKTELLTQRFLALLPTVRDPEEIVALTFTNKAAAEMRLRIADSLALAACGQRPGADQPHRQITYDLGRRALEADREKDWGLLVHPGRLQITTLDALCGRLARQMPFLSRFGAQPAVSPDATPLYREAARATLDLLEDEGPHQEILARVLAYFDNDGRRVQSLLESMLATRDQWLGHVHGAEAGPDREALGRLVESELAAIAGVLPADLQQDIMAAARYAGGTAAEAGLDAVAVLADWTAPLAPRLADLPRWRGLAELLLTKAGTLRSRFEPKLKLSEKEAKPLAAALKDAIERLRGQAGAESLLARIGQLPDPAGGDADWPLIADFSQLLTLAAAQLWLVFQERRQVDFIEVAQNALAALGSGDASSELRERLDYRIGHLLVDEFQDTSPTQVRLLELLTADWTEGDGRTLFLVGDPMQSIYRFRKADVGLFLQVRARGLGGLRLKPLRLYRNNRSQRPLVEWANAAFPAVFAAEDDPRRGAVSFSPAAPTRDGAADAGVGVHALVDGDFDEDEDESAAGIGSPADRREARRVVELLRQARAEAPQESVAVLVRARRHLTALVAELRRAGPGLSYQAVEIEALDQRQAVQDLLALTRALHHRADRLHWLAILRAPWCGLTLADLHALAADDHRSTIWQLMRDADRLARLSEDGRRRLGHLRGVLAEAYAHQGRQRPRRWVEGVWQRLGGPLCLRDEGEAVDARAFLTLLDQVDAGGGLDLERLDEEVAKLYAAPDPEGGAIQLMTVHKAKGLEFDTVILPGLHRPLRGDERSLVVWEEVLLEDGREHLVAAPLPRRRDKNGPPACYDYLMEFEQQRAQHESQRLLYVAATRAKKRLHLLGTVKPSTKEDEACKAPPANSALALLWPVLAEDFEAAATAARTRAGDPENTAAAAASPFIPRLERLAAPEATPFPAAPAADLARSDTTNPDNGEETGDETGGGLESEVGTLVHRCLERIAREGPDAWTPDRLHGQVPRWRDWLARRGHDAGACAEGARRVVRSLEATLSSEFGRWLLQPHAEAASELPVSAPAADGAGSAAHVIDRCFVAEGQRWIVDYKTAWRDGDGQDEDGLSAFLATQAERHRPQLARYAALFADDGLPVRCGIFFTAYGRWVALD